MPFIVPLSSPMVVSQGPSTGTQNTPLRGGDNQEQKLIFLNTTVTLLKHFFLNIYQFPQEP